MTKKIASAAVPVAVGPETPVPGRRVGSHVPSTHVLEEAAARGADVVQVFCSNPRGWRAPARRHRLTAEIGEALSRGDLVGYAHAPYLVNLCSADEALRQKSVDLVRATLVTAAGIGLRGVVVHGGQAGAAEADEGRGRRFDWWAESWQGLAETIRESGVLLLVENTAGGRGAAARRPQDLSRVLDLGYAIVGEGRVGACLDTAHAWAAGWTTRGLGAEARVELIHANGASVRANSGADRHANLYAGASGEQADEAVEELSRGEGDDEISEGGEKAASTDVGERVLNRIPELYIDAALRVSAGRDVVVETPGGPEAQQRDIEWLRGREQG